MSESTTTASAPEPNEAPSAFLDNGPTDADLGAEPEAVEPAEPAAPAEPKTVPLAALHEERARRKELTENVRRMETRFADMQRFLQQQNAPKAAEIPSIEVDPVGHFKARNEQLEAQLQQVAQPIQRQQQEAQFVGAYRAAAADFARETPDFGDAYAHALREMAADAQTLGLPVTEVESAVVARALQEGANPAERIYNYAKRRGYGAGKAAATPADGLAAMQRGAGASRSAGGAGAAPEANTTAARLASMSVKDIGAMSDAEWKKAMGG